MSAVGNLRKMRVEAINENGKTKVYYSLPLYHKLEKHQEIPLNDCIGSKLKLSFTGNIHCVVTGKKINKTFGEGMSYDAFKTSPLAVESIIRPELSQIHLGIALRDEAWEREHHLQPHTVYLSYTGDVKVGVTRDTQIPTRWIDQGAVAAIPIAHTPYRQAAGLIEVALKKSFADKTNWRKMLSQVNLESDLEQEKAKALQLLPENLAEFGIGTSEISFFHYPVISYPAKVASVGFDKQPVIQEKLTGIKGQYLIFESGNVFNVRAHTAYETQIEIL